jgi:hypothetical protein
MDKNPRIITMSNGRIIFIDDSSVIKEEGNWLLLDSSKSYEIMIQPVSQNNLKIAAVKISDYIFKSKTISINVNNILYIDEIDNNNTIYKTVSKERSGLILPNSN